ncbi:membrane protein [[Pantoea] beijingensis]|uniref:Membrane protein n=1 Tax=[Pantoea] beijingensis TaxID=1324864 RepID=A0A443IDU0_9GAMM|nr:MULTISPECIES: SLC13 family permease [Erwiniaceae]RWR02096.1 membrane protein [[Pantoea] beijingensis]
MTTLLKPFLHDRFLHVLIILGMMCAFFAPFQLSQLPQAVDWNTISTLCGLLILTKGIESSGYFDVLGRRIIQYFQHDRTLAVFMVSAAALLSTFLTNDVALFILVPLTLTLRKFSTLPVSRLIIFEALAVNTGSLLTPIGNPQNILLWSHGNIRFLQFIGQMLPLAALLLGSLLLLTVLSFSNRKIHLHSAEGTDVWQHRLFYVSVLLYVIFIVSLEMRLVVWALLLVFLVFLMLSRRILVAIDWSLLAVFIAMFIDVFLLTQLPLLQVPLQQISRLSEGKTYLLAAGLSQVISNVPATILLLTTLPASQLLAWAVNIGGFGLLPGSLANIIALRMAQDRRIWMHFHFYSIPLFLWALAIGWVGFLFLRAI